MTMTEGIRWVGVLSVALGLLGGPSAYAQTTGQDAGDKSQVTETRQRTAEDAGDDAVKNDRNDDHIDAENIEAQGPTGDDAGFGTGAVGLPDEPIPDDDSNESADTD